MLYVKVMSLHCIQRLQQAIFIQRSFFILGEKIKKRGNKSINHLADMQLTRGGLNKGPFAVVLHLDRQTFYNLFFLGFYIELLENRASVILLTHSNF